jgi:hypothetical protein
MPIDDDVIREHAQALCDALVAGDMDLVTADFSPELRKNLGEVLALLPLPSTEAAVQSVDHRGSGFDAVLRLVGESEEVLVQTRWKDRDGRPTVVEASHLSRVATTSEGGENGEPPAGGEDEEAPA